MITGPGNVYVAAAKRLVRGRVGVDAEAGPTEIAILADDTADPVHVAADLISQAEHDTLAAAVLVTPSRRLAQAVDGEVERQVGTDQARGAGPRGTRPDSSRPWCWSVISSRGSRLWTPTRPNTWRCSPPTPAAGPSGCATPVACSSAPTRRSRLGDYCARVESRPAHRLYGTALLRAVRADLPQGHAPRRVQPRRARGGGAARLGVGGRRGPAGTRRRGDGPACTVSGGPRAASATAAIALADLPLRDELRGVPPYGAPQLDVPVRLNTNENPYPPSGAVVDAVAAAARAAAGTLNRYPDREARALRADLAAYLARDGAPGLSGDEVWAANGSNEVMTQLLQAFGGPGRTALSFAPTYSMYQRVRPGHAHAVEARAAQRGLQHRPRGCGRGDRRAPPVGGTARVAEQPDRHRAAAGGRGGHPGLRAGDRRGRRGLRGVPPTQARRAR